MLFAIVFSLFLLPKNYPNAGRDAVEFTIVIAEKYFENNTVLYFTVVYCITILIWFTTRGL